MSAVAPQAGSLRRVLGFGVSVALAFGMTIGVGILRLPGTVAAALGDPTLVVLVWVGGGIYALLGAISVAELAAMIPRAGGFTVYARRAFGERGGFLAGWNDWIQNFVTVSYAALAAADFLSGLAPGIGAHTTGAAVAIVVLFTGLHWIGVRTGAGIQNGVSALVGTMLIALLIGAFVAKPAAVAPAAPVIAPVFGSAAFVAALIAALRSVIVTYDGWYGAIYLAEETVDAERNVPRAMIICAALVTVLFVLLNVAFLHALSLPVLAASKLPAADVARAFLPRGGAEFVTVVSLFTVLSLLNASTLSGPRVLFAISRDIVGGQVAQVSESGTPRVALLVTNAASILLILSGSLEQLVAVAAVMFVLNYVYAYLSLFRLRWTEPDASRPFRTPGFPVTSGIVFAGAVVFFVVAVVDDPHSGALLAGLTALAVPVYVWLRRRRR